jgi:hypothetical protein
MSGPNNTADDMKWGREYRESFNHGPRKGDLDETMFPSAGLRGRSDSLQGLSVPHRIALRLTERIDDLKPPVLKSAAEGLAILALFSYGLTRGYIEDAQDTIGDLASKGLHNIQG